MSFFNIDRFRKMGLKGLFEALINSDVTIILNSGLSYSGVIVKVFNLSLNKTISVYVTLIEDSGKKCIIKVNDVVVVTKSKDV